VPNPNLVTSPRKWKNKLLLLKLETTYGVDSTPTGAADWVETRDLTLTPMEADKVDRNIVLPYYGNAGSILTGFWAKLSFNVALVGSGTAGTAPKWSPAMLACGTAQTIVATTSVAYNLVSQGQVSVVGYMNIDGVLHKLLGMRGNCKGSMAKKDTPKLMFDFDALYVTPVTGAAPAVTRSGWAIEEGINSVNTAPATINAASLAWSSFEWDFGNQISRVDMPGPQKEIVIGDRKPSASITVLAPDLAVFNPFTIAESNAAVPMTINHGSVGGKKIRVDLQAKIVDVSYEEIDGMAGYKLGLEPTPAAGNDELALTCL
jgi:hypothetical protein